MKVTVNGIELDHMSDLTIMKNSELNMLLGEGGQPKYSVNQLKSKTKIQLADEAREIVNDAADRLKKPRKNAGVADRPKSLRPGAAMKVSKTKDSAASKLSNTLKAVVNKTKTAAQAWIIWEYDTVLQEYCNREAFTIKLANAELGERPRTREVTQITIDLTT